MLREETERFKQMAAMMLPTVFSINTLKDISIDNDEAQLQYVLAEPMSIEDFLDDMEDLMQLIPLYHHRLSRAIFFGQSGCLYSNPHFGHMYKINGSTDDSGVIAIIDVTIYSSLDYMCEALRTELLQKGRQGHFLYQRQDSELLTDFIC